MAKTKKEETTQLVEYDVDIATIGEWKQKYAGMKITDADSDKAVRAARTFMVSQRTAVDKWRINKNEDANIWRKKVNKRANEIIALLLPIEEPLQAECQRVDDEKARVKAEKERKEQARKDNIRAKIFGIQSYNATLLALKSLPALSVLSDQLEDMEIKETEYMEFTEEANNALNTSYDAVQDAIANRIKLDKEDAERKAEDARLEAQRKKQEAAQAKIDEANKKIEDEKAQLEGEKKAEREKKEFDEKLKDLKAKAEEEAKEKLEQAERNRIAKEKADKAEKARQEALKPDRQKLIAFANDMLEVHIPELKSEKARTVLFDGQNRLNELSADIKNQAQKL